MLCFTTSNFLCINDLSGSTVCSCWTRKDTTVCSLSTASCFCLVNLPKQLAKTHFSCFASTRGHTQREHETELLVERAYFGARMGMWIFFAPNCQSPLLQKKKASATTHESVHSPRRDMIKTPNFLLQSWPCPFKCLASTQAQLRRLSLYGWHFVFSCKCLILLSPQGQRVGGCRGSTPACLPHCSQFNFECTFANQFLWLWWKLRGGGGGGNKAVKQQILLEGSQPAKKNCRWGMDRNSKVVEFSLIVILWPPPLLCPFIFIISL